MLVTSLMPRARYHQWANVQLTDFLLEAEQTGMFDRREETRSTVREILCRTMTVDCQWLDRLEGRELDNHASRFETMEFAVLLKARSLLDARLMAAVHRLGPAASDETVAASNGVKIGLPAVVRFMLARNQRQRTYIADVLSELDLMPPLMGERLFEARTRRLGRQNVVSTSIDSRALAGCGIVRAQRSNKKWGVSSMPWARVGIALCVLLLLAAGPARANEAEVSGDELRELLTGNSIDGVWGDTHYIQYFSDTGRTLYKADGSPGDWGTWRINDAGYYCSTWRGGGENCYSVVDMDGTLYWKSEGGGATYPFTIIEGNATGE